MQFFTIVNSSKSEEKGEKLRKKEESMEYFNF